VTGRLSFLPTDAEPVPTAGCQFFTEDLSLVAYQPFCDDFGPFNLGMTNRFCRSLRDLLTQERHTDCELVFFTSTDPRRVTNAVFLLGAFLVTHLNVTPEQAWAPFSSLSSVVEPFRDATWCRSTFPLTVVDCFRGLRRAMSAGLYSPEDFNCDEVFVQHSCLS